MSFDINEFYNEEEYDIESLGQNKDEYTALIQKIENKFVEFKEIILECKKAQEILYLNGFFISEKCWDDEGVEYNCADF